MKHATSSRARPSASLLLLAAAVVTGPHSRPVSLAAQSVPASQGTEAGVERPVVVASKPFAESYVLGEIFAQLLEDRGIPVERRLGLGATELAFQGVRSGSVDVYPEYTGTGLLAILGERPPANEGDAAAAVFRRVSEAFYERWGVHWLPPLGFENSYAVAVRRETARRLGLETLSDLAGVAGELDAGFSPDFIGRSDGLPGLTATYGVHFGAVRSLLQPVKYEALAAGRVDVIDGYSTDGQIARYDLVILEDDRDFFPPYDAAPLVSARLASDQPRAVAVLAQTAGRFDVRTIRELNRRVETEGESPARAARIALVRAGLLPAGDSLDSSAAGGGPPTGAPAEVEGRDRTGALAYIWARRGELAGMALRHLLLAGVSLLLAVLVAVPLGLLLERRRESAETVVRAVGLLQTVPSIALLAFMVPLLGIGVVPALVALFLYSLFPILRNTFSGVRDADPLAVSAGRAIGMTPGQLLRQVRLPLAAPVIMAGIRTAAVINVGTATLAAFIGAGGLGDPIVSGLALADDRMILSGAIPAAMLAFAADGLLHLAEGWVTPGGLSEDPGRA